MTSSVDENDLPECLYSNCGNGLLMKQVTGRGRLPLGCEFGTGQTTDWAASMYGMWKRQKGACTDKDQEAFVVADPLEGSFLE